MSDFFGPSDDPFVQSSETLTSSPDPVVVPGIPGMTHNAVNRPYEDSEITEYSEHGNLHRGERTFTYEIHLANNGKFHWNVHETTTYPIGTAIPTELRQGGYADSPDEAHELLSQVIKRR